ncbi:sensor histidine kinase [Streptomyces pseudovenezuelae]|uniref:histidine kinase n=1 Tax=Streptomyces pseudovenezuelae TaxID=67350 RepID=A0ABT6LK13_9ACTN|nr:histidine kinase [Streptomyces pseudovenezuelae]MDH6216613.1 signal transduction histidine kinase [Streptomyces pseudovenezuelae]
MTARSPRRSTSREQAATSSGYRRPGDERILERLTTDADQRVLTSLILRLAAWRRADTAHPQIRRWAVPALCAWLGTLSLLNPANGDALPQLALLLAFSVPLLWRERRPLLVFTLVTAAAVTALPLGVASGADTARFVALYHVGRLCTPRQMVLALTVTVAVLGWWTAIIWRSEQMDQATRPASVTIMSVITLVAVAALGLLSRLVNAYIDALRHERDQQADLATARERARVSREMHDILGHTLAVIVGLADGAAALAATKPERGAQTLRLIGESGRDALAELRRLLAVIGDEDDRPGDSQLAPQPRLTDLDDLLDRVRAAGPTVILDTRGDLTGLAPGLQLSVYRIVQEALTNTVKYAASDTSVHVTLTAAPDAVHVTVEDTGPARTPSTGRPSKRIGRGLVGIRERAALYGGNVTAGPNTDGGWTVQALLVPTPQPNSPEKHPS